MVLILKSIKKRKSMPIRLVSRVPGCVSVIADEDIYHAYRDSLTEIRFEAYEKTEDKRKPRRK